MRRSSTLLVLVAIALAACATSYDSTFRGGPVAKQITDRVWQIDAGGNAFTSSQTTSEFALLKAAEVADAEGYPYFLVLAAQDGTDPYVYDTGQHAHVFDKPTSSMRVLMLSKADYAALAREERFMTNATREVLARLRPEHL
jgi:hypothetical protein